jgi:hypothetical protein
MKTIHGSKPMTTMTDHYMTALRDLEKYFEDRADADDGIPNDAMRHLVEIRQIITDYDR